MATAGFAITTGRMKPQCTRDVETLAVQDARTSSSQSALARARVVRALASGLGGRLAASLAAVAVVVPASAQPPTLSCPRGTQVEVITEPQARVELCMKATTDGQRIPHGPYISVQPGGRKGEGEYRDGAMHGRWIIWHGTGHKSGEAEYRDGLVEGRIIAWHPNGQTAATGEFRAGVPQGTFTFFDEQGRRRMTLTFPGARERTARLWDERGQEIPEDDRTVTSILETSGFMYFVFFTGVRPP
jgi:hypothetical protein